MGFLFQNKDTKEDVKNENNHKPIPLLCNIFIL